MKHLITVFALLLLAACSTPRQQVAAPNSIQSTPGDDEVQMNNVAIYAMSLYDTPYQYGGTSRVNGFDCSGFVQFVYQNSLGLQLPRTSAEMSQIGTPLDISELRPGDLVFFNTTRHPNSHVGIYVGENRFVHAPKTGKAIMITSLNSKYWHARFNGGRRIPLSRQFAANQ